MAVVAAAVFVAYLVGIAVCFWWQSWRGHRRRGDSGFRRPAHAVGSPGWWAGVLLVSALVLGALGPATVAVGVRSPFGALELEGVLAVTLVVLGVSLAATGMGLAVRAQQWMGASWRIGVHDGANRKSPGVLDHLPRALERA